MSVDQVSLEDITIDGADQAAFSDEMVAQTYRTAVMASLNLNGKPKLEPFKTPPDADGVQRDIASVSEDSPYAISLRMPDGSVERWKQIAYEHNDETDFRAVAYQRCDEDWNVYTQDGGPHTCLIFPGSQNTVIDRATAKDIVAGEDMSARFAEAQKFAEGVVGYIQKDCRPVDEGGRGYGEGRVDIGSHSMGVYGAVAAIHTVRDQLCIDTQNTVIAPFGAGQALEQYSEFLAGEKGDALAISDSIEAGTTSLRPNVATIFSETHIGPGEGGNDMIGQKLSYAPTIYDEKFLGGADDKFLGTEFDNRNVLAHNEYTLANSLLANGKKALEPRNVFEGSHQSWGWDHTDSLANVDRFNSTVGGAVDLQNMFNIASAVVQSVMSFVSDPQEFMRPSFGLSPEPPGLPEPPGSDGPQLAQAAEKDYIAAPAV
ncbi:hypothetical protein N9Z27_01105 [Alphaproteobacteria bacterium]|nr:hypothetical protein [Alphaproteobacteria bacterium]